MDTRTHNPRGSFEVARWRRHDDARLVLKQDGTLHARKGKVWRRIKGEWGATTAGQYAAANGYTHTGNTFFVPKDSFLSLKPVPHPWDAGRVEPLVIETTPHTPHAHQVFTPAEMEDRIRFHQQRIEADMAKLPPLQENRGKGRQPKAKAGSAHYRTYTLCERIEKNRGKLADGRDADTLILVPCGGCRTLLVGPDDEYLRALGDKRFKLPPASVGWTRGRPLCEGCTPQKVGAA